MFATLDLLLEKLYFKSERFWQRVFASNTLRRGLFMLLLALMLFSGLLLLEIIKVTNSSNAEHQASYYQVLWWSNITLLAILATVIATVFIHLIQGLRLKRFGSQILLKLAIIFTLVGFLPGVSIYFIANQFVNHSIDSWFEVEMTPALDAAISLGQSPLKLLEQESSHQIQLIQKNWKNLSTSEILTELETMRKQLNVQRLEAWSKDGILIGLSYSQELSNYQLIPPNIEPSSWESNIQTNVVGVNKDPTAQPRIELSFSISSTANQFHSKLYFKAVKLIPNSLITNALLVQDAQRSYQELIIGRDGLKRMYVAVLTLSLFLAVLVALLLAALLSNSLARPLLWLTDSMRMVTSGDLAVPPALSGKDELSVLTRSFANMTKQLDEAQQLIKISALNEQRARANLQIILDSLSSGVIVMNHNFIITEFNPAASNILQQPLINYLNQSINNISLDDFTELVIKEFNEFILDGSQSVKAKSWQQALQLASGEGAERTIKNLVLRGVLLPDQRWLLVFEDITKEASVQRIQAWSEVARRLAHEIKNPLTPIRLSADRLQMKLQDALQGDQKKLLNKSVNTIIDQVDAMIRLVNEFRDYARLPIAKLEPTDLNAVVRDTLLLYPDNQQASIQTELTDANTSIMADAQQLRQVIHNLLQNAQDAAGSVTGQISTVFLTTEVFLQQAEVKLTIRDNGPGFSEHMLERMFEPYTTTKAKGTGLGLPVVKKILDEHDARINIHNLLKDGVVCGAQIEVIFNASHLNIQNSFAF